MRARANLEIPELSPQSLNPFKTLRRAADASSILSLKAAQNAFDAGRRCAKLTLDPIRTAAVPVCREQTYLESHPGAQLLQPNPGPVLRHVASSQALAERNPLLRGFLGFGLLSKGSVCESGLSQVRTGFEMVSTLALPGSS